MLGQRILRILLLELLSSVASFQTSNQWTSHREFSWDQVCLPSTGQKLELVKVNTGNWGSRWFQILHQRGVAIFGVYIDRGQNDVPGNSSLHPSKTPLQAQISALPWCWFMTNSHGLEILPTLIHISLHFDILKSRGLPVCHGTSCCECQSYELEWPSLWMNIFRSLSLLTRQRVDQPDMQKYCLPGRLPTIEVSNISFVTGLEGCGTQFKAAKMQEVGKAITQ